MRTAGSLIQEASGRLKDAGLSDPRRDAGLLLAAALDLPAWKPLVEPAIPVQPGARRRFLDLVRRRCHHEPVAYLLGEREFWGRSFEVGPGVLVPRPETEGLVEAALRKVSGRAPRIAEIGTGSGCVAVSLALELPGARLVATDTSISALEVARRNALRHGVADRVDLRPGRDFSPLEEAGGRFDMLVSNPPYVAREDWAELDRQVRDWEPREALVAGATGLEVLARICAEADRFLRPGGWLLLEVGMGQAGEVCALLGGWRCEITPDMAGIDRIVAAGRRGTRGREDG